VIIARAQRGVEAMSQGFDDGAETTFGECIPRIRPPQLLAKTDAPDTIQLPAKKRAILTMMTYRQLQRCAVATLILVAAATSSALAQTYPSRVIKIVVPFAAGGQPDTVARLIAQHIATTVGPAIIDNRPGANTTIGAKAVASAEPDGYTILFGSSTSLAIAPALNSGAGYDPVKSFTPIASLSRSPMFLTVGPAVQAKTVAELIAYAKANPKKLNFAAPTGGPPHLAGELFMRATGIEMVPVSYRSMNQAFTDMLGGQMDIVFDSPAPLVPLMREGKIRALVSLGPKRLAEIPDVPTMVESGLPDVQAVTWNGFVAPAGTPDAIVARLNAAINAALKSADIRETLSNFGSEPLGGTPQDFAAFIASESKKWTDAIVLAGVKIE
jgi:tripartite-type tricarboxylate transporter receptor subunit TctC